MRPVTRLPDARARAARDDRAQELYRYLDHVGEACPLEIRLDHPHWTRQERMRALLDLLNAGSAVMTEHDDDGDRYHLFAATQAGTVVDLGAWRERAA